MFRITALLGMLSLMLLQACMGKGGVPDGKATPISLEDVLTAHGVAKKPEITTGFIAEAIRKVSVNGPAIGNGSTTFMRVMNVAQNGRMFRYQRTDESSFTKQIGVFDGNVFYHLMSSNGKLVDNTARPGESVSEQVMIEMKTFGLLPILHRLMDSKSESVFEGRTEQGLDRLRVSMSEREWVLFVDADHLIQRLESKDNVIEYYDYRETQGVRLPFRQRFFSRGKLYHELTFSSVDLRPAFPSDYFTRAAVLRELTGSS